MVEEDKEENSMKKIMESEILTLDDNKEFICIARMNEGSTTYLALVSNYRPLEFRFAKEIIEGNDISLEIIYDQEEKEKVFNLYQKVMKERM